MRAEPDMSARLLICVVAFICLETCAVAAAECFPYCDYTHYYGPFDFTYEEPGLFGYPRCGLRGNCSPHLVYSTAGIRRGRITVRFMRAKTTHPEP
jgi:hypothetical protein